MAIKNKKLLLIPVIMVLKFCLIAVIVQLLYPKNHALPGAVLFDKNTSYKTTSDIESKILEDFSVKSITIKAGSTEKNVLLRDLGANVNPEFMSSQLTYYPWTQRLIPFSILFKKPKINYYSVGFTNTKDNEYVKNQILPVFNTEPKDGNIEIKDGQIKVNKGSEGVSIDLSSILEQIQNTRFSDSTNVVELKSKVVEPKISDKDIQTAYNKASEYAKHSITVVGQNGLEHKISHEAILKMLDIKSSENNSVEVSINESELTNNLKAVGSTFYIAPETSIVSLIDGEETSRSSAKLGQTIDSQSLKQSIQDALNSSVLNNKITVKMLDVPANLSYQRTYTNTQKGLQAYLNRASQIANVRIYIKQLDGAGWTAGTRQNEQTVSASTYKLYVSLLVFEKINKGEINLSTKILNTDVAGCLEEMLIISTNRCAEEWINQFGRENINNYIHARGISGATSFTHPVATQTSAQDLVTVLSGINNSSLMSEPGRSMLLERLARQKWRSGIPTGTKGWAQDKVGFLWSYTHDAGIVHTPKGTYIMAVMTNGGSYSSIAQITRDVESIMYP